MYEIPSVLAPKSLTMKQKSKSCIEIKREVKKVNKKTEIPTKILFYYIQLDDTIKKGFIHT